MEVEPSLVKNYVTTGKAKLIYRHLTQLGEDSEYAAESMHCAGDQGKYWEMRYTLYERQGDLLSTGSLEGGLRFLADELKLDSERFTSCITNRTYRAVVETDAQAAQAAGIRSRPVFDVNGQRLIGYHRYEDFAAILDKP
jgi:protein-disulfide isomerase